MLDGLQRGLEPLGYSLHPICVDETQFAGAPVSGRYPQEMYYRLLAAQLLPDDLERIHAYYTQPIHYLILIMK